MAIATDVRQEIVTALANSPVPVFAQQASTMPVPSIVIQPDTPYVTPYGTGKRSYTVALRLSIQVGALDAIAALESIESLADYLFDAIPDGVQIGSLSAPRLESLGQGQGSVYTADLNITALAQKEGS